jgi:hypothetical protein
MGRLMDHTIGHLRPASGARRRAHSHSPCTSRPVGIRTSKTA